MNIPPFWAKGRHEATDRRGRRQTFLACGWSFSSLEEARNDAAARARRVFERLSRGQKPDRYEYHDRPIREEIVDEISEGGAPVAVITRNRYGALVLNCAGAMFVDIDFPKPQPAGFLDTLRLVFSPKHREAKQRAAAETAIEQVRQWARQNRSRGFRLYRTREGLRVLFTDGLYDPTSAETAATLKQLGADPMYVTLTEKQQCFRARLTSKPWRCGCLAPPGGFPWDDEAAERAFRDWEADYTRREARFKVCELIEEVGPPAASRSLGTVIELHDRLARITADAPLA